MARSLSIVAMLMAFAAVLAACRTVPASVDAAAALPGGLALQQRLTFVREGRRDTIDALVEVDAAEVRVVAHAQGQVALRFTWNGETLTQVRDERLPAAVQAARVLDELQFAYWPIAAIAAALPAGWTLDGEAAHRVLRHRDVSTPVLEVTHRDDGTVRLVYPGQGWELHIESRAVTP